MTSLLTSSSVSVNRQHGGAQAAGHKLIFRAKCGSELSMFGQVPGQASGSTAQLCALSETRGLLGLSAFCVGSR